MQKNFETKDIISIEKQIKYREKHCENGNNDQREIKKLTYTMPWPPQAHDLDQTKINIVNYLDLLLKTFSPGCSTESSSSKVNRLTL